MQANKRLREDPVDALSTLDQLRSFILANTFDDQELPEQILECIPTVIVLGDQSSGKSSLLSAVAKCDLPTGTGRTTASRIELRFRQSPTPKKTIRIELDDGSIHNEQDLVADSLSVAHDFLISHALTRSQDNEFFADGAIVLNIEGPSEKNMTLVDLPGLIIPVDDLSSRRSTAIHSMIKRYIDKPNCLIVHVLDASRDTETVISRSKLIRNPDIPASRVVNVFTKLDMLHQAYRTAKCNELYEKVGQGIFVHCRDSEGKPVDEDSLAIHDARFLVGREHLLTRVEKFTQDYLKEKHHSLIGLLKSFQVKITEHLRKLGYRQKQGHEIYRTYSDGLLKVMREIKEDDKEYTVLVNRVHQTVPLKIPIALDSKDIQARLIDERGLRLCSPVEIIIRSYIKDGIQEIQNQIQTWQLDFQRTLRADIQRNLHLEGYTSTCKLMDDHLDKHLTTYLQSLMASLTEETQTYLEESHSSPTLFDRKDFDSHVAYSTSSLPVLRKVSADLLTNTPHQQILVYLQAEIRRIETRAGEVEVIKSQIQEYWKTRMHILQNNLHNKLSTIRNKIFDQFVQAIGDFQDVHLLVEDDSDIHHRETYLHADSLVNQCLLALG